MLRSARPREEALDVNQLVPNRRGLEARLGKFRIVLDDQGYPIRIEKRHSTLKTFGAPFTEAPLQAILAQDGVSEDDYQKYVKPHIRYP